MQTTLCHGRLMVQIVELDTDRNHNELYYGTLNIPHVNT